MKPSLLTIAAAAAGVLIATAAHAQIATRNMQFLAQRNDYPPAAGARGYSACWSYIHSDGREYAVLGVRTGTAIYNVTDPASTYQVAFIPGPVSQWREMKSYRDWIYVSTEGVGPSPPPGLQIIRMTDPENPVLATTWTGGFIRCHTVSVDTARALIACNGARRADGHGVGMFILSLVNPESPVELANWPGGRTLASADSEYVHDSEFRGDRLYLSCIDWGTVRVLDVANPIAPVEIASWNYAGGYTHNTALDRTERWLYATDEVKGEPLKVFDIADLDAPRLANSFICNPEAVVHNAFVKDDELLANYSEGLRVLDITDPAHPAEFAWADSWLSPDGPFVGVWNVCPFYPSGTVIASDFNAGLLVYRPIRDYGLLRLEVVDGVTLLPVAGATVTLTSQGETLTTPADGIVQFAPSPGAHTVSAGKFGYVGAEVGRAVSTGSRDTVRVTITPIPSGNLEGMLTRLDTHAPLDDAEVDLDGTPIHTHADGYYLLQDVPDGDYRLEIHRPGFAPIVANRHLGPPDSFQDFELMPASSWDAFEAESGWMVGDPNDRAAGIWARVTPITDAVAGASLDSPGQRSATAHGLGHGNPPRLAPEHEGELSPMYPRQLQPTADRTPGTGTMCFLTEQYGTVIGGTTTLTSPPLDIAAMEDPTIGYWRWFYSDGDSRDWLAVLISGDGGANWTTVDTTRGIRNHWEEQSVRVRDYFKNASTMRLRFVVNEGGAISAVEAAVDDITTWDAALSPLPVDPKTSPAALAFRAAWPNPSSNRVSLTLAIPRAGPLEVEVLDLAGRRVRTLHHGPATAGTLSLSWDGTDEAGRPAPAGLFFTRARVGAAIAQARIARVR